MGLSQTVYELNGDYESQITNFSYPSKFHAPINGGSPWNFVTSGSKKRD